MKVPSSFEASEDSLAGKKVSETEVYRVVEDSWNVISSETGCRPDA